MGYEEMKRVCLANLPTPLEELKNLRKAIGGPRIFMKRDDLNGLGLGGNKLRKLEFLLGDAIDKGCDVIITSGDGQTNHGRLTAAACAKMGLKCYLVITSDKVDTFEGNQILQYIFGAKEVFTDVDYSVAPENMAKERLRAGDAKIAELVAKLKSEGHKPYVIPRGGRSTCSTASYCKAMVDEVKPQLLERGVDKLDYIISPCATSSTMTGITLGNKVSGLNAKIYGIALSRSIEEGKNMLMEEFMKDAAFMHYDEKLTYEEINILDDYIGDGYAIPTKAGIEAIKLFAETEGIVLDPTYTGKTASAYVDMVKKGFFKEDDTVLLFHTGGIPLLFLESTAKMIKEMKDSGR